MDMKQILSLLAGGRRMLCGGESVKGQKSEEVQRFNAMREYAEHGDADAQFNLGVMYDKGQGVSQDYAEAAKW